ncbi:hypothetical protein [Candidatus Cardinium hertigii]|jgi:hypothetical protein|uniref:Uncharacterized protein n=1 Tax=Candidatus Cardinium hertigii TaxID=247481 RepID=A0A3N2QD78_9BACT|nr:hypothetical protein [Candidatus Cardinium hertigii]ROT47724.1 hypothetical protein EDM02_00945 [Candidatus Cardinium hertigii]
MSLISNIFEKLFGRSNHYEEEQTERIEDADEKLFDLGNHYEEEQMERIEDADEELFDLGNHYEEERAEKIEDADESLESWIIATVKEKGCLSFTWESGSDEAFVTFKDSTDVDRNNFEDLETYIIDTLDIPDAGEFQMNGSGDIYIDNNLVRAKYSSTTKAIIDYNEETDQVIYDEEEYHDSADEVLFAIEK